MPDRVLGEGTMGFAVEAGQARTQHTPPRSPDQPRPGHRWVTHQQPAQQSWAVFAPQKVSVWTGVGVEVAGEGHPEI